jgi:hypothetical protein
MYVIAVSHRQVTLFGDVGDGPAVPVFHPVGRGESEAAVVAAGDDHISDAAAVPVGQRHLGCGGGVIETMRPARWLRLDGNGALCNNPDEQN